MFEHRRQPLITRKAFAWRVLRHAGFAFSIIAGALGIGVVGYHWTEGLSWIDALVNAAMILGGMGPLQPLHTDAGKLFAAFYALFSGLIFLVVVGVFFAPVIHRFLHRLHVDAENDNDSPS